MSMMRPYRLPRRRRLPAVRPSHADPKFCGELFGKLIRSLREADGRPIEELALLAGLTTAGWEVIEAGEAPGAVAQLLWLARALHLGNSWLPHMIRLCARAYDKI